MSAATLGAVTTVREAVERAASQLVDEHVPLPWRKRAKLYLPLVVDRITLAVESVLKGANDG